MKSVQLTPVPATPASVGADAGGDVQLNVSDMTLGSLSFCRTSQVVIQIADEEGLEKAAGYTQLRRTVTRKGFCFEILLAEEGCHSAPKVGM
jgi:hypothetical protein